MFNIQNKYNSFGCYRFLNSAAKPIYVGTSKNVHRRLFSQHFKSNGTYGHLPEECYKSTYKIEIVKTKDYAQALALEQYLIDTYIPRFNNRDKRKDIFKSTNFDNIDYYKKLEKWKLYYTFKEYDFNKNTTSKVQNRLAVVSTYLFLILLVGYMLKNIL